MKKEIWKDIPGYEGLYKVSNLGNVKSFKKWNVNSKKYIYEEKILRLIDNGNGYLYVGIVKNKKRKNKYVHRLVAEAFLKNYKKNFVINHKDYNKKNNKIENLECITQKQNINYSKKNMKHFHNSKPNKLNEKYIRKKFNKYELTLKRKYIGLYSTLEQAIEIRNKIIGGDKYYDGVNIK